MRSNNGREPTFPGFSSPNGTIVPDEVFDVLMPNLSDAQFRVLMYIIRRTFGFKKNSDDISLKQMVEGIRTKDGRVLDGGTGLSKSAVAKGAKDLVGMGVIEAIRNRSAERGNEPTTYRLHFRDLTKLEPSASGNDENPDVPSRDGSDPLVLQKDKGVVHQEDKPLSTRRTHNKQVKQTTDFDLSNFERSHDQERTMDEARTEAGSTQPEHVAQAEPASELPPRPPLMSLGEILRLRQQAAASIGGSPAHPPASAGQMDPATPCRKGQPPGSGEEREQLAAYLGDFARELGDAAPLASTITRVLTLFQTAGLPRERWGDTLYQARAITQEHTAQIRTLAADGGTSIRRKNKMPYFLAVLEDLLDPGDERPAAPGS